MEHLGKRTDYYPSLNKPVEESKLKYFKNPNTKINQSHNYSQIEGPSSFKKENDNMKYFGGSLKRAKYQSITPGAVS